jgi:DNA-directed RNA polymerase specialized sigma24 family protein
MTDRLDVTLLPLTAVADSCCREAAQFTPNRENDSAFCLELFRRALQRMQNDAWSHIMACFTSYVRGQFYHHSMWRAALKFQDEHVYIVEAFTRLWKSNQSRPLVVESVGGVLAFLKRCLHCAIMDEIRLWRPVQVKLPQGSVAKQPDVAGVDDHGLAAVEVTSASLVDAETAVAPGPSMDDIVIWREQLRQLLDCCVTPSERRLLVLRWIQGYQPRVIAERWPDDYPTPSNISQTLQNVLARYYRRMRKLDQGE